MATLGDAFIEVHADTSPFRREVRAAVARMSRDVQQDVDRQGSSIGRRLGQRIREGMSQGLGRNRVRRDAVVDLRTSLDRASAVRTEAAISRVARDRDVNLRVDRRSIAQVQNLGDVLGTIFQRTFTSVDRIFSSIIDIGERVPGSGFALMTVLAAGFTELIGLMGFAAEAALGLASTLPLIGLVGAAAISPLILIFSNLGDAFGTLSGDAGEFREAIKGLGNDTQFVFRQMRDAVGFFLDIREQVQENFFGPIREALEELDTGPLSTVFAAGFGGVASAAGRLVGSFIELFEHPEASRFFQNVFRLAELTFDEVGGAVVELLGAIVNMANETIPDVEEGIRNVGDLISGWADALNEFVDSGDFRAWLDDAESKLNLIFGVLEGFWNLISTIVEQTDEDVAILLSDLTETLNKLAEFFESESGETALEGMRITLEIILVLLKAFSVLWATIFTIIGGIGRLLDGVILGDMAELQAFVDEIRTDVFGMNGEWENVRATIADILYAIINTFLPTLEGRVIGAIILMVEQWTLVGQRIAGALELAIGLADATRGDLASAAARLASGWDKVTGAIQDGTEKAGRLRGAAGGVNANLAAAKSQANQLADALNRAANNSSRIRTGGVSGGPNRLVADGGIFTTMQNVTIAEAGPEVVIPLTRPQRARELIEATNLMDLVRGGDGAAAMGGARGSSGFGAAPEVHLTFISDGTRAGDAILEVIRHGVRIRGGNVQTVVGRNG